MMIGGLASLWGDDRRLRRLLLVIDAGLIAFWAYSVAYISGHPAEKGSDGFEFILEVPMTGIALFLSLPAVLLLISNRTLRFGAGTTLLAIVMNVVTWSLILSDGGLGRKWTCGTFWTLCW